MAEKSCYVCSKRKVKCDRLPICSRCKHRGDVCEYPKLNARSLNASSGLEKRLKDLEQHVRLLGGDPDQSNRLAGAKRETDPDQIISKSSPNRPQQKNSSARSTLSGTSDHPEATLVEHDKQLSYVETPMWYSWSEAKKVDQQPSQELPEQIQQQKPHSSGPLGCTSLFSHLPPGKSGPLFECHPPANMVLRLWDRYLTNVHPLTKIFFDWETESLIRTASSEPKNLSPGEHALTLAIYFISTLSLSDHESENLLGIPKSQALDESQSNVETALLNAGFIATNECVVLQAFVLYLIAMRTRINPKTLSSLMALAGRIAERIGLHRDGSLFGLSVVRAEERRRLWWQMQHMEISFAQLVGCIPLTVLADWDAQFPANLEDRDIHNGLDALPSNRHGLTSMSNCLWRYIILYWQRKRKSSDGKKEGWTWLSSARVSLAEKNARFDELERAFGQDFLQFCEPLNPLHLSIQIGIRSCLLAARRTIIQPRLANAKISDMSHHDRENLVEVCTRQLEYCVMSETEASIAHFRWYNDSFFPWIPLIYTIMEAHYQVTQPFVVHLWDLVNKMCSVHSRLTMASDRPEIASVQRLILLAWRQREDYLQQLHAQNLALLPVERPWCVTELHRKLNPAPNNDAQHGQAASAPLMDFSPFDLEDSYNLDFDVINWPFWEMQGGLDVS